ncbi:isoprenyl transferase [Gracilibacillus alcaliphilus]|uniref:isoprenyl transferase n=1 Tax=Gracilibacillus alcaliphilus TaxID=1401441 RepID=UPI001958FC49|nr:isoprenyl transferase [Gracilibacillus alcaliphilus]MBM7677965.1 undecaprenyl diphosphate synthase [Gracilibacillus alcaliphilus]
MHLFKLPFKKIREKEQLLSAEINVPEHVAIIMDGNGRWAQKRGLPRIAGHREGMDNVKRVVKAANHMGIHILTLYAFSTENWKRPTSEVEYIMKLPIDFLQHYLPELIEENVRIETIGEIERLPKNTRAAILRAKDQTANNTGLILNIAINYGSRGEMLHSIKEIYQEVQEGKYSINDITEETLSKHLYTKNYQDPDLLIRTSGEVRLSNFLLWQSAYSELWFTETLWPDFGPEEFGKAIQDFQQRKRRFGGI